ncbi:F-box/FBD/LRR-repeat protein At1g13570-like isoform X2 [Abrus precatorius]|uniref:F-box/FBD/LRR-repeat protein At1g13570-like isoform X2 n=1 Tax=Abrus precatorius TaxID=3816 RepID=A0A8B8JNI7_ABRPR|nr:F-box/FBD/LRR-repeat protein At1g13570-like isoform X2 [Abrus precatorius]XP_027332204.1 F-box/FBD/LRR-repeat protein At1g13570-like isoform X2 [Abrus precatorius]
MGKEQSQSPCLTDVEPDRISCLPDHVVDHILSYVSIREAVRTSVLSSKWRYKWATQPNLVFDNQCVPVASQDLTIIKNKLLRAIDHVLLLHFGEINKFKLSHRDLIGVTDIDRWTSHLCRRSIKEFVLEIWKGQRYKIPSYLFSCQSLTHLELFNCWLKPPSNFRGFRNLKSLDLQHVTLAQDVFENLISNCPQLERLTLMNFDGFTQLNIDAPNLLFFDIGGRFEDVSFKNTSQLAVVSIGLYLNFEINHSRLHVGSSNLLKFFYHLPHVQRLEVQSYFLKYLAVGVVPINLPRECADLSYLSIRINFNDSKEISAALCLLRNSPNLQELEILGRPEEQTVLSTDNYCWEDVYLTCSVMQLRYVRIDGISGIQPELDFISFLLIYSPELERMTVKPGSSVGSELMKELLRFRRSSGRAEIIYVEPS